MAERSEGKTNKICYAREMNFFLSLELITEILSWLPVQSIIVSKCVCKQWKSIIEDPKFLELRMSRASTVILIGEPGDIDVKGNAFKIACACEALILETTGALCRVKNPATRQVLCLPAHVKEPGLVHFTYLSASMVYKLFHLYVKGGSQDIDCEVLSVGEDLAWRGLNIPTLKNIYEGNPRLFLSANDNDKFNIIRIAKDGLQHPTIIFLDFGTESASCFEILRKFLWDWSDVYPMLWKEKLSLTTIVEDKLIVWVLENCKINQWADREIIIPLTYVRGLFKVGDKVCVSVLSDNILDINVNDDYMISYDIEKNEVIRIGKVPVYQKLSFKVCPSLVQLKGMQAERKN